MKLKMFSVYDSKAAAYLPPFFYSNAGLAIRAFSDTVQDPKSMLARHPGDYTLFEIGEFDDATGVCQACNPVNLGTALQFVTYKQEMGPLFDKLPKEDASHG